MERGRIIEILIAMMFIVLIVILVLMGINLGNKESNISSTTIANSYNKYYINNNPAPVQKVYYSVPAEEVYKKIYYKDYNSIGKHIKQRELGFYYDDYKVYVSNYRPGDYYTVRFYFNDYWGNEKNYDIRKYIYHGEEQIFHYRDVSKDMREYNRWRYDIIN